MKKFMLLLMALFLLVLSACGSSEVETLEVEETVEKEEEEEKIEEPVKEEQGKGEQEVSEFVTDFNNLASLSDDVEPLFDKEQIDENGAQVLYASEQSVGVIAEYQDDESIYYSVIFLKEDPYKELTGTGLNTLLHVATILDIDTDKLLVKFEESLSKEVSTYFGEVYTVMFFNKELTEDSPLGMAVQIVEL